MVWAIFLVAIVIGGAYIVALTFSNCNYFIKYKKSDKKKNKTSFDYSLEQDSLFLTSPYIAGLEGEHRVNAHLKTLLKEDEYLLEHLLLPINNGHKTEVDSVLITRKGIFCIEIKNWSGHIYGNDDDETWLQKTRDPDKPHIEHNNPVRQNDWHCFILEKLLSDKYELYCAVIFSHLEKKNSIFSYYTYTIKDFIDFYGNLEEELSVVEIKSIYDKLSPYVATAIELDEHKEYVINALLNKI